MCFHLQPIDSQAKTMKFIFLLLVCVMLLGVSLGRRGNGAKSAKARALERDRKAKRALSRDLKDRSSAAAKRAALKNSAEAKREAEANKVRAAEEKSRKAAAEARAKKDHASAAAAKARVEQGKAAVGGS